MVRREPELAILHLFDDVLHHDTLEAAVVYRPAERLNHTALSSDLIRQVYMDALKDTPSIGEEFRADLMATADRDPATAPSYRTRAVLQGLSCHSDPSAGRTGLEQRSRRLRAVSAEPFLCGVPM